MRLKGFVLIEKEGKYLLIKEASPKWKGKWFIPGGSIKPFESLESGTRREVREEAGCEVQLISVFYIKRSSGFFNKKNSIFFYGKIVGEKIKKQADGESLDVKWFTYEELEKIPLRQNLKKIIDIYRTHTDFIPAEKFTWNDSHYL